MMRRADGIFLNSRDYGFEITRALVTPHILRRRVSCGIQNYIKQSAEAYLAAGHLEAELNNLELQEPADEQPVLPDADNEVGICILLPKLHIFRPC